MRSVAWGDNVSLKKFIGRRLLIREKNERATLYFFTGRRARALVDYFGFFVCLQLRNYILCWSKEKQEMEAL